METIYLNVINSIMTHPNKMFSIIRNRSHKNMLNNRGPSIDPCMKEKKIDR